MRKKRGAANAAAGQEVFWLRAALTIRAKTSPVGSHRTISRAPGGIRWSAKTVISKMILSPSVEISGMLPGRRSSASIERDMPELECKSLAGRIFTPEPLLCRG